MASAYHFATKLLDGDGAKSSSRILEVIYLSSCEVSGCQTHETRSANASHSFLLAKYQPYWRNTSHESKFLLARRPRAIASRPSYNSRNYARDRLASIVQLS